VVQDLKSQESRDRHRVTEDTESGTGTERAVRGTILRAKGYTAEYDLSTMQSGVPAGIYGVCGLRCAAGGAYGVDGAKRG
jgi:hypothetical protein